jgi:hypothetical protein
MTARSFGPYRGIVIDDQDPEHRMRLKVRVPAVLEEVATIWALPCVPPGLELMPKVGDVVWVEFEAGDPSYPVWMGMLESKTAARDPER